eukprot:TRINITY_DN2536_c0_g1_i1.p1 TRINITY_DN2536_c0_g1~~TRINITY_DN2536_c0_g1_i1.p1  ORF type:complete len:266 (-),score=50.86 TRINITY_DN2536_c0_g1_i1:596-1393(-)
MGASASMSVVSVDNAASNDSDDDSSPVEMIQRQSPAPSFGASDRAVRTFVITSFGSGRGGVGLTILGGSSGSMGPLMSMGLGLGSSSMMGGSAANRTAWGSRPPTSSSPSIALTQRHGSARGRFGPDEDDDDEFDASLIGQINRLTLERLGNPMGGSMFSPWSSIWDTLPFNLVLFIPSNPEFVPEGLPESKLNELETRHTRSLLEKDLALLEAGDDECVVCHENYHVGEKVTYLPSCSHFFHVACIRPWLERSDTCPLCRCKVT